MAAGSVSQLMLLHREHRASLASAHMLAMFGKLAQLVAAGEDAPVSSCWRHSA
jgi:hypothetical protein